MTRSIRSGRITEVTSGGPDCPYPIAVDGGLPYGWAWGWGMAVGAALEGAAVAAGPRMMQAAGSSHCSERAASQTEEQRNWQEDAQQPQGVTG